MTPQALYLLAGIAVVALGFHGTLARSHLFWKILGIKLAGSGIFLILLAGPARLPEGGADPVPQAMVLTGIVVAVSAAALALGMALRVIARTGHPYLEEEAAGREGVPDPVRSGDGSG